MKRLTTAHILMVAFFKFLMIPTVMVFASSNAPNIILILVDDMMVSDLEHMPKTRALIGDGKHTKLIVSKSLLIF